jgi:hypothetical protein
MQLAETQTVQLLPADPSLLPPRPLILDPTLRFPLTSRLLAEWTQLRSDPTRTDVVRQPWVLCGLDVDQARVQMAEAAGVRVVRVQLEGGESQAGVWLGRELTTQVGYPLRPCLRFSGIWAYGPS